MNGNTTQDHVAGVAFTCDGTFKVTECSRYYDGFKRYEHNELKERIYTFHVIFIGRHKEQQENRFMRFLLPRIPPLLSEQTRKLSMNK